MSSAAPQNQNSVSKSEPDAAAVTTNRTEIILHIVTPPAQVVSAGAAPTSTPVTQTAAVTQPAPASQPAAALPETSIIDAAPFGAATVATSAATIAAAPRRSVENADTQSAPAKPSVATKEETAPTPVRNVVAPAPVRNVKIIPALPKNSDRKVYTVQGGAYRNVAETQEAVGHLLSVGLVPVIEPYKDMWRVAIAKIPAQEIAAKVKIIGQAGFAEVWLRTN